MTDEERARDLIWRITGPSGVCRPSEPNVAAVTAFIRQVRAEAYERAATKAPEYGLHGFMAWCEAEAAAERAGKETGR